MYVYKMKNNDTYILPFEFSCSASKESIPDCVASYFSTKTDSRGDGNPHVCGEDFKFGK